MQEHPLGGQAGLAAEGLDQEAELLELGGREALAIAVTDEADGDGVLVVEVGVGST